MSLEDEPLFLALELVLHVHRRVTEEFGGDLGIRDPALLESALGMPAAQFAREFLHPTLAAMAAAYLFHLCKNHPFIDGNKRTALATAEVFLVLHDRALAATNAELYELTIGVAQGSLSKQDAIEFFEERVSPAR